MDNYVATGYRVAGLTVQIAQGDLKDSLYMQGLNTGDFEDVKAIIEAGGEWVVTGFSITLRDKKEKEGTLVIPAGSAEKYKKSQIGLKRTVEIAGQETEMKTLYLPFYIPEDKVKKEAIRTAFINKTIAGAKVIDVLDNKTGSLGA